jgi:hypothetical protein
MTVSRAIPCSDSVVRLDRHARARARFGRVGRTVLCILIVTAAAACQNRKVKVEIDASGEQASRVFATNDTSRRSLEGIEAVYGSEGESDAELGRRFTGTFADSAMPSEIGNRGAIGRVDSALGSARVYYEQFADRREEWTSLRERVEGGILWMQLFGRFIELRKIKDEPARGEFSRWWNSEAIPFAADTVLLYSGMQAASQAQRIGAMPRNAGDFTPRTVDETFRLSLFEPLVIHFAERGWLTPDELAAAQMLAINGNVSGRERAWVADKVFSPAVARLAARIDPTRKDMKLKDFVPLAIEFVLWTKLSREYRDLVLASPAIPEVTKEAIRAGKWDFELPPPFGFRTMERPKVTDADVYLDTGAEPFFTNGRWNPESRRVEFKGGFYEDKYRYAPYNPPYYAVWALPAQKQESVFGAVVVEGEPLAEYCAWEASLDEPLRKRWLDALDTLASTKDAAAAYAVMAELAKDHPLPIEIARWIAERAGQPIPEGIRERTATGTAVGASAGEARDPAAATPDAPASTSGADRATRGSVGSVGSVDSADAAGSSAG